MVLTLPLLERWFPRGTPWSAQPPAGTLLATSRYRKCSLGPQRGWFISAVQETGRMRRKGPPWRTPRGTAAPPPPQHVAPGVGHNRHSLGNLASPALRDGCLQGPAAAPLWGNPWMAAPSPQPRPPRRVGSCSRSRSLQGQHPGVPERNSCRAFHGGGVQSVRLHPPAPAQQVTRLPSTWPQRHPSLLAQAGITSGEEPRSRCLEALGAQQTQPGLAGAGVQEGPPRPCLTAVCLHPPGGSVCVPGGWSSQGPRQAGVGMGDRVWLEFLFGAGQGQA